MSERFYPRSAAAFTALGIALTGAGCAEAKRQPPAPPPPSAPGHIEPMHVGRIVIDYVTVPGLNPVAQPDQAPRVVEKAWALHHKTGPNPETPVPTIISGGNHTFGDEVGEPTPLCREDETNANYANRLKEAVFEASTEEPRPSDLRIIMMDTSEFNCEEGIGDSLASIPTAAADPETPTIFMYKGTGSEGVSLAHELDHTRTGYDHDNSMHCNPEDPHIITISADCKSNEYGNKNTLMGSGWTDQDADPKSGFQLQRLGVIGKEQVQVLEESGEYDLTLNAITDKSDDLKLVHIPFTVPSINFLTQFHANSLILELSGDYKDGTEQRTTLKAILANSHALDDPESPTPTYILPLGENQSFGEQGLDENGKNKPITFKIGDTIITITMTDLRRGQEPASGQADVTIQVQNAKK